ncbi:MAG: thioredoxin family protein [Prolixibacteraceae bacterium]|jgi:small redox-active disulfide protein 2|nr:thioredoxin family protein [Prolixibacteraceae bacterium]
MEIKILGTGCSKCKNLEKATLQAIQELSIEASVIKVEDIVEIMQYGVMQTPGLVINGKVVLTGKLPSNPKLKELILTNQ